MSINPLKLFHYSEEPDIQHFVPRPHKTLAGEMVWAVDAFHAVNFLVPRDCPRVTFYVGATSTPADIERLMGHTEAEHVIAVESAWLPRIRACRLYEYAMPIDPFELEDVHAGYYISRTAVTPSTCREIPDVMAELLRHSVELRITPSLWRLRDQVADSSLEFSISRMRNAAPPLNFTPKYPV